MRLAMSNGDSRSLGRAGRFSLAAALVLASSISAAATELPPGFQETLLVSNLEAPTAMAWAPDGELWIIGQHGDVWLWRSGALIHVAKLAVSADGERGLGGIALDPDYPSNGNVWLYYTTATAPIHNRLSRFTRVGDQLVAETVILDGPTLENSVHNGGCLRFASDKTLFLGMGDDDQGVITAQDTHDLRGKILHINRDGSGVADNPFHDGAAGDPRVWAYGFRNPWRFSLQPISEALFIGDVGASTFEELDIGVRGGNFGWGWVEGPEPPAQPGYVYPIYWYTHDPVVGGAIIAGDHAKPGDFSPAYLGNYFFADFTTGRLFRMVLDGSNTPVSTEVFATQAVYPVDMRFGPDGALYYLSFNAGTVRRIAYAGGTNRQPVAVASAVPDSGPAPLVAHLDAASSYDPDGDPLAFTWDFGDGQSGRERVVDHTYPAGSYTASLKVADGKGGSATAAALRVVSGNNPPTVSITSPSLPRTYRVGDLIYFSGTATDPEEGTLPCSHFTWRVILHHRDHTHPFLGPLQGSCGGSFVAIRHELPNYYEIQLAVEDSGVPLGPQGTLTTVRSVEIPPAALGQAGSN